MNEPVIDIRDRIEKMRNQMTPQSSQNQEKSFQKSSKIPDSEINKIDSEKRNLVKLQVKINIKMNTKKVFQMMLLRKKKNLIKILKILKQLLK